MSRPYLPLADYGLIGDCRGAALVARDGTIDWACLPRFDSAAIFARLLDRTRGGYWQIAPVADRCLSSLAYVEESAVLESVHRTGTGTLRLRDAILSPEQAGSSALIRVCECLDGELELVSRFEPRGDFGRRELRLETREDALVAGAAAALLFLRSSLRQHEAEMRFPLAQGERAVFVLSWDGGGVRPGDAPAMLEQVIEWWREWCRSCFYDGPYRDAVLRSAITLKLLTHAPSGAIVAAPTTSLPEEVGGERNWDYRYAWLRDASLTSTPCSRPASAAKHTRSSTGSALASATTRR